MPRDFECVGDILATKSAAPACNHCQFLQLQVSSFVLLFHLCHSPSDLHSWCWPLTSIRQSLFDGVYMLLQQQLSVVACYVMLRVVVTNRHVAS